MKTSLMETKTPLKNATESFWRPSFTLTWPGMCFTLNRTEAEGSTMVHMFLNTNLTFIVFVHDPDFFLYTYNPQVFFLYGQRHLDSS